MKVEKLAELLKEAKAAHVVYEREHPDGEHDWPNWYAHFMAEKLANEAQERPKTEGHHENEHNAKYRELYSDMIREAHKVDQVIIGHHLVYVDIIKGADGFEYHIPAEIPSADALIFDHYEAQKIWGEDFKTVLARLAMEPIEARDLLLKELYYSR